MICATPSQVGTGRGGVLTSLLPAPRGQSISQSPISCPAPSFLPHAPASLLRLHHHSPCCHIPAPASLITILLPHWFCIPMLLHLPRHTSASPCSCLPSPHPCSCIPLPWSYTPNSFYIPIPRAAPASPYLLLSASSPHLMVLHPHSFCISTSHTAPASPQLLLSASPHPVLLPPYSFCIPISPIPSLPPSTPPTPHRSFPLPSPPRSLLGGLQHLQLLGGEPGEAVPGTAPLHHPCTRSPWDPNALHDSPAALRGGDAP